MAWIALAPALVMAACSGPGRLAVVPPSADAITASAWGIADADTGRVIAAHNADVPHKSASITKTMTALLVTELAASDPRVLDEQVVYTEAAASRVGSEAGIEAGEALSVRDNLYALMLPSGNDAGYAFAQHFNRRFTPSDASETGQGFIAAMNRKAAALGMKHTRYRSAFGDGGTPQDRTTTVRDLFRLARAATAQPLLSQVMGTRTFATEARRADGTARAVSWVNTNKLLDDAAVTGIKTGTTKLAKACLLTEVTIAGRRYFVVVLGSATNEDRYTDTMKIAAKVQR